MYILGSSCRACCTFIFKLRLLLEWLEDNGRLWTFVVNLGESYRITLKMLIQAFKATVYLWLALVLNRGFNFVCAYRIQLYNVGIVAGGLLDFKMISTHKKLVSWPKAYRSILIGLWWDLFRNSRGWDTFWRANQPDFWFGTKLLCWWALRQRKLRVPQFSALRR